MRLTLWSAPSSLRTRWVPQGRSANPPSVIMPPRRASSALRGTLGRTDGVAQEHGTGHRADSTEPGRDPPGHLVHVLVDVGEQLLARPAGPGPDHGGPRLDHVSGHQAGPFG